MYTHPFGEKLEPVIQTDRSPKQLFVLGVYACAHQLFPLRFPNTGDIP